MNEIQKITIFTWMRYKRLQYLHELDTKDYNIYMNELQKITIFLKKMTQLQRN